MERRTTTLTTTTKVLGTYYYAAPEQLQALKNAGPEADIFSVGTVLEALVRGQHPLPGTKHPPTPFREIIRRATETDPADRYPDIGEFLADIERVVAVPRGRWESTEEALECLRARIEQEFDEGDLDALMDIAMNTSEDDLEVARDLSIVMAELDEDQIAYLWEKDHDGFRHHVPTVFSGDPALHELYLCFLR